MDCKDLRIKERLPEFLMGDLSPDEERVIRDHLDRCGECGREVEFLSFMAADQDIKLPDGFRVVVPEKVPASRVSGWRWSLRPLVPAGAAAFLAAALILLFLGIRSPVPPDVDGQTLARYLSGSLEAAIPGFEDAIFSNSGLLDADLDQTLSREMALVIEGEGHAPLGNGLLSGLLEVMDPETIKVFEGFLDAMAPEGAERGQV